MVLYFTVSFKLLFYLFETMAEVIRLLKSTLTSAVTQLNKLDELDNCFLTPQAQEAHCTSWTV